MSSTASAPPETADPATVFKPGSLRRIGWSVIRIYILLLLMMMFMERALIFRPTAYPDGNWNPESLAYEDAWFTADDGVKLHGWFCEHPDPQAVVLYCHGNAGNLSYRVDRMRDLLSLDASVMIFDYRGYGRSEGSPDEAGIMADARAARKWLAERVQRDEQDIVLLGNSLGGAVAVDLATDGAKALVLENTFTSLPDVAAVHYPFVPARWIMRTRLDSLSKIVRYKGPLLLAHGTADSIIPYDLGRRLFAAANEPKQMFSVKGGDHNDGIKPAYKQALREFLSALK